MGRFEIGSQAFLFNAGVLNAWVTMIRKAAIKDVVTIHELLAHYAAREELLPRPRSELYDHLRDFSVFEDAAGNLLGCCALAFCWKDLAEIRSLAVRPDHTGKGIGSALVEEAIEEAMRFEIEKLFALTYRPAFFAKFAFTRIDRNDLPIKIWGACLNCVKFPNCDEIAMMRNL